MKKVFSVLLSLVMLMSLLSVGVAVSAATPDSQVIEAYAGETIKVKFTEDNCYGVSGAIEYSNRNLFASVTPGGSTSYGKITDKAFILSSADKVTCEVVLSVKIAEDAKVGDTCVVSFTDCELVENNEDFTGRSGYTKTVTVKIVKKPTTTSTTTTKKPTTSTTKKPTTTTKPSTSPTKTPSTTNPALDYTKLIQQIEIAESLNKDDWTPESWAQLESALDLAWDVMYSARYQKEINDAADALEQAIAALVPVDGGEVDPSKLIALIEEVMKWLEENDENGVFADLYAALAQAKDALASGDQDAIDEAYEVLLAAFNALKDQWPELFGAKEVEAKECTESCHIWHGKFWTTKGGHVFVVIMLIISLVLNLIFVALIVLYFIKRKKNAADTTPLVDYDINDD